MSSTGGGLVRVTTPYRVSTPPRCARGDVLYRTAGGAAHVTPIAQEAILGCSAISHADAQTGGETATAGQCTVSGDGVRPLERAEGIEHPMLNLVKLTFYR